VGPALAITAGDVLNKMEPLKQSGFLGGAVDMASHFFAVEGNSAKAKCAVDWFFRDEKSVSEIFVFFEAQKDKDAVALLHVLINRKCGN
jgi:hypothetical protein